MTLHGAALTPLDGNVSKELVAWLLDGQGECPLPDFSPQWAVLQCSDALVWGVWRDGRWVWASEADPVGIRKPTAATLLEARIFGPEAEALVWRSGGGWAGRRLADDPAVAAALKPICRSLRFDGDESDKSTLPHGFVAHVTTGGRVVVAPGRELKTREYLADVDNTGLLRIAATRFVEVK